MKKWQMYYIMAYFQNRSNMLSWFYNGPTNTKTIVANTGFMVGGVDISNTYVGLGTNSKISVSNNHTISYTFQQGGTLVNIGSLFELNLPVFASGAVIGIDYKILPTSSHNGLLIQILKSTTLSFNYNVDCSFAMIGGGGGGGRGNVNEGNAGGGGGAGELVTGKITGFVPTGGNYLSITIGDGGAGGTTNLAPSNPKAETITRIRYLTATSTVIGDISANGGGEGAAGKQASLSMRGSSTGGGGSYSNSATSSGAAISRNPISTISIFNSMTSYNFKGIGGNDDNSDNGSGGGGGGAGSASPVDVYPGKGGSGKDVEFGSTTITLGGGGGGGAWAGGTGGQGGSGGGGNGGNNGLGGSNGTANTGGGGGGGANVGGTNNGGAGGSGTVILYIVPAGVTL